MPTCEKCRQPIVGEVYRWNEHQTLCLPCKKGMLDAALPGALRRLKAEFEAPSMQRALSRFLNDNEPRN